MELKSNSHITRKPKIKICLMKRHLELWKLNFDKYQEYFKVVKI